MKGFVVRAQVFQVVDGIYRISIAPGGRFEFNHFLILDERPVLVHTGRVLWFGQVKRHVADLVKLDEIAYVVFSHFEADECGALNEWLRVAPGAVPLANAVGSASIEDFSIRSPEVVCDGQRISLGRRDLIVLETPHFPHNWDAVLYFEETEGVLFASDLGAHLGVGEPTTETDVTDLVLELQRKTGFMAGGRSLVRAIEKLERLDIRYLATQHGSTIRGACIPRLLECLKTEFG